MDRRSFHRNLLLAAVAAPVAGAPWGQQTARAAPDPAMPRRRSLTEYELPPAAETHEMIKLPGKPMVLVSQMSNSTLVKLQLDPATEQVTGIQPFPLGAPNERLHGLSVSSRYPGKSGRRWRRVTNWYSWTLGWTGSIARRRSSARSPSLAVARAPITWVSMATSCG